MVSARTRGQPRTRAVYAVLQEFPEVFKDELGCYNGDEVSIKVHADVQSRFVKSRTIPLSYLPGAGRRPA